MKKKWVILSEAERYIKHKSIFFIFILVLSVTLLPTLFSETASAAPITSASKADDHDWQIKSYLYYKAISACFSYNGAQVLRGAKDIDGGNKWGIEEADAASGAWFSDTPQYNIGYYFAKSRYDILVPIDTSLLRSQSIRCQDKKFITDAMALWGLDPLGVLCWSGFHRETIHKVGDQERNCATDSGSAFVLNKDWRKANNTWKMSNAFRKFIIWQVYGVGDETTQGDLGNVPENEVTIGFWGLGDAKTNARYWFYLREVMKNANFVPSIYSPPDKPAGTSGFTDIKWLSLGATMAESTLITGTYSDETPDASKSYSIFPASIQTEPYKSLKSQPAIIQAYSDQSQKLYDYFQDPANEAIFQTIKTSSTYIEDQTFDKTPPDSTCEIKGGLGWLVCQVTQFLADIADKAYGYISKEFLVIPTGENALLGTEAKDSWQKFVTLANIAFIMAFLIIIMSQLTSVGLDNYGLKKMLPKLVVAIILVNVSFYLCQLAVDLSNIVGNSISGFIDSSFIANTRAAVEKIPVNGTGVDGGLGGLARNVLVGFGIGAVLAALGVLIPVAIGAVIACVMILLILSARKAIILILVVIAPLAFVAYLLPNTEKLFATWKKTFMAMLMLYPITAFIFSGSRLASSIIAKSATAGAAATDEPSAITQTLAAAVAVLPLFVIPGLLKKSLDGIAGIGNMVNKLSSGAKGMGDKFSGKVNKKAGDAYKGWRSERKDFKTLEALNSDKKYSPRRYMAQKKLEKEAILANRKKELGVTNAGYISKKAKEDTKFRAKLAEGGGEGADQRAEAGAINTQNKQWKEDVAAAETVFTDKAYDDTQLANTVTTGLLADGTTRASSEQIEAAIRMVGRTGSVKQINRVVDYSATHNAATATNAEERKNNIRIQQALGEELGKNSSRPKVSVSGGALGAMSTGTHAQLTRDIREETLQKGKTTAAGWAGMDKDELEIIKNEISTYSLDAQQKATAIRGITEAYTNDNTKGTISREQKNHYQDILAALGAPPVSIL